jgi:transcriptional regulator with XRE-family HTH domain
LASALDRVVADHCRETGDTQEDVAADLGISSSYLSNMRNGHSPVQADVLIRLTRLTGNTHAIVVAADLCGGMFIRYPKVDQNASRLNMGIAIRTFGEFVVEMESDKADGKLTPEELERIERDGADAMRAVQTVIVDAREQAKRGGVKEAI